ncbi:MAG: hypothetical protein AAF845_01410 [Bacteroidota bacterium]
MATLLTETRSDTVKSRLPRPEPFAPTRSTSAGAVSRLVVRVNVSAIAASRPLRPEAADHAAGSVAEVT